MKYGIREICEVVLRAKAAQKIGNKIFYKNEPVIYFDSLKTSSLEGAASTVYAQGGRGNSRLVAWEGERTVTFTMEDALISPEGFMILSGAGLIEATEDKPIYQHMFETTDEVVVLDGEKNAELIASMEGTEAGDMIIYLKYPAYLPTDKNDNYAYVMLMKDGEPASEPIIPEHNAKTAEAVNGLYPIVVKKAAMANYWVEACKNDEGAASYEIDAELQKEFVSGMAVLVDYYVERKGGAKQIDITPDKFGGNYYLEASTLFRDTDGVDKPAEFVIPNCKIQSNFTFTMASSGDPSSFTFTMDAFPDYTRFNKTKKVLASLQIIEDDTGAAEIARCRTPHKPEHDDLFID